MASSLPPLPAQLHVQPPTSASSADAVPSAYDPGAGAAVESLLVTCCETFLRYVRGYIEEALRDEWTVERFQAFLEQPFAPLWALRGLVIFSRTNVRPLPRCSLWMRGPVCRVPRLQLQAI